jgi:hypothetical protein
MGAFLELQHGGLGNQDVDLVGTVHDMRFVFLDNDTKLVCRNRPTAPRNIGPHVRESRNGIPFYLLTRGVRFRDIRQTLHQSSIFAQFHGVP